MCRSHTGRVYGCLAGIAVVGFAVCPAQAETVQILEEFSADPGWEGMNNRPVGEPWDTKTQDFGYSGTNHAGGEPGEIGGRIFRSTTPAYYARTIPVKTLEDRLSASGRIAVTASSGGSGVLVGWFNSGSRGWRTPNSLVFRIDGESGAFRVFFEYGTQSWGTGGGRTFEGRYQVSKTPLHRADGTPHTWALEYDPEGAEGAGEMTFTLDGVEYKAPLRPGHREEGAAFDRFGILNQQISGDELTLYLDDVAIDGTVEDFAADPGWEGVGNRVTFQDHVKRPIHDFGYRNTNHAGGRPGEVGGVMWRVESTRPENACSYGRPVGRLTLEDELVASGKVAFRAGAADSAILMGWFNSRTAIGAPPANFLGVLVEGPSRVGHYFRAAYGTSNDLKAVQGSGPVMRPDGVPHEWRVHYTPGADGGGGRIAVALDNEEVVLELESAARKGNAVFDRFGFLSWHRGGHYVEIYFDDIEYTAGKSAGR